MSLSLHRSCRLLLSGALAATAAAAASKPSRGGVNPRGSAPSSPVGAMLRQTPADPCVGEIAFVSARDGNFEIYSMNSDGTGQTRLTNAPAAFDQAPSWSPDGSKIAFHSDRDNAEFSRPDIYVMDADGGNVRRLTTDPEDDALPVWSPDGTKIAFLSSRDDHVFHSRQLYVMSADGSGQTRLTSGGIVDGAPAWSPDGSKIAFARFSGVEPAHDIFTIDPGGGPVTRITFDPDTDYGPSWSPDGTQIAFSFLHGSLGSRWDIFLMNADGSNRRNLTNTPGVDEGGAVWSPDGGAIAFNVPSGAGTADIYLMYPDGSGRTNLTNGTARNESVAWRPTQTAEPCLLRELNTGRAVAVDSVTFTPGPFEVTTPHNFSQDGRTRVSLFARNLRLLPGDDASAVTAQAEVARGAVVPLEVEFVGVVPDSPWLTQVNVKLPDELKGAGDALVSVTLRGAESNKAVVGIAPGGGAP